VVIPLNHPDTGESFCNLIPFKQGDTNETPAFCVGCNSAGECVEDPACKANWVATCGDRNGCFKWDPGGGLGVGATMEIDGRVRLNPDCGGTLPNTMGRSGDYPINYKGKGILSSDAKLAIAGDILSSTDSMGKFVEDHLVAVLTKGDMVMDASIDIMGAFYALGNIASGNNTTVVGAMMSNSFYLPTGAGSASVYYVDQLSDELYGMGMLKSATVYTFKTYAWSEEF